MESLIKKFAKNFMNLKSNVLIFIIILSLVSLGCGSHKAYNVSYEELWKQVPLRSLAQKEVGLIGGEGMQMIFGIAYAPSNPEVVYLVSNTSQVWKSIDGGNSWQMKHKGFLANGGISLAVQPNNENIVFVAGSRGNSAQSNELADGIYRTQDGGENWILVKQTPFYGLGSKKGGVNFVFAGTGTIYAGTHEEGLLKSTDGGDTWSTLLMSEDFNGGKILDVKVNPQDSSVIFLATEDGLYKVTDIGTITLEQIGNGLPGFPRAIAINPNNPDIVYATVGKHEVYKSTDGGESWRKISPPHILHGGAMDIDHQDGNLYVASVPEGGEEDITNFSFGIYKSTNEGNSWQAIHNDELLKISLKITSLTVDPHYEGRIYLTTMGNGIIVGEPAE